jgi:hypothetical protein
MVLFKKTCLTLAAAVLILGSAGCKKKEEGPAERLGKQIDQGVEKTGQEVNKAAEKMGQEVEKAGEKIKEAAEKK